MKKTPHAQLWRWNTAPLLAFQLGDAGADRLVARDAVRHAVEAEDDARPEHGEDDVAVAELRKVRGGANIADVWPPLLHSHRK